MLTGVITGGNNKVVPLNNGGRMGKDRGNCNCKVLYRVFDSVFSVNIASSGYYAFGSGANVYRKFTTVSPTVFKGTSSVETRFSRCLRALHRDPGTRNTRRVCARNRGRMFTRGRHERGNVPMGSGAVIRLTGLYGCLGISFNSCFGNCRLPGSDGFFDNGCWVDTRRTSGRGCEVCRVGLLFLEHPFVDV